MGLDVCHVRVKFVTLDAHKMFCSMDSEMDFQHMYNIYYMFNNTTVDLIVNIDEREVAILSDSSFPS